MLNSSGFNKHMKQCQAVPCNALLLLWQLTGISFPRSSSSQVYHKHIDSKVYMKTVTGFNKKHIIRAGYNHFERIAA